MKIYTRWDRTSVTGSRTPKSVLCNVRVCSSVMGSHDEKRASLELSFEHHHDDGHYETMAVSMTLDEAHRLHGEMAEAIAFCQERLRE